MKTIFCNILMIWFLVIQSSGASAIASIPMEDERHCLAAIVDIQYKGIAKVQYNCIDAGYIKI